jgi:uncharacterized protein YijF (DUF1287 family)
MPCFTEQMLAMLKSRTNQAEEETLYNIVEEDGKYRFRGYPQGDYLKQVSVCFDVLRWTRFVWLCVFGRKKEGFRLGFGLSLVLHSMT